MSWIQRRLLPTVLLALGTLVSLACQQQPEMDVLGQAPSFQLTDQQSQPFSSQDLAGRASLVDFIYTHCTDACPLLSATFADAARKLAADNALGSRAMLVSLSVDPQHDTPSVLAEYAQRFKADPASWKFLTGDWDQVYDVITGFKVATRLPRPAPEAPPPGGTELSHTTRMVLVDGQGQIRAYLHGEEATADDLVAALKRVMRGNRQ